MILHELYFDGLGAEGEPDNALREALVRDFGSIERWRTEFIAMGKAMGGGSGWVLLTYFVPRPQAHQPMGGGPHARARRGHPDSRARHVRAFVPSRLRRRRGEVRRRVHGEHPLGQRFAAASAARDDEQGDHS